MKEQIVRVKYHGTSLDISVSIQNRTPDWVVCLHGLQSNKKLFDSLVEQPVFNEHSTMAIDFVGFGMSEKPVDFPYTVDEQAVVVEHLLSTLKARKLTLIGHSLGGMVGILLLEPFKGNITAFVNMEGNLVLSDCGPSKDVARTDFTQFQANGYQALIQQAAQAHRQRAAWLRDTPDYVFYKMSQSIVEVSESEKLVGLFADAKCRRLFVCGDENRGKTEAVPKGVTCRQISNSGHFMLLDNPAETYACLVEFLAQ